jgi:hypothetical protein
MTGSARNWTRVQAKLALDEYSSKMTRGDIHLVWLLENKQFRRFTVRALQAEVFDGRSDWPAMRLMDEAIDEWLHETASRIR